VPMRSRVCMLTCLCVCARACGCVSTHLCHTFQCFTHGHHTRRISTSLHFRMYSRDAIALHRRSINDFCMVCSCTGRTKRLSAGLWEPGLHCRYVYLSWRRPVLVYTGPQPLSPRLHNLRYRTLRMACSLTWRKHNGCSCALLACVGRSRRMPRSTF
jgi:hypothetical protein